MNVTTATAPRTVTTYHCLVCDRAQGFTDLRERDRIEHRCGWHGSGSTWWVFRGAELPRASA